MLIARTAVAEASSGRSAMENERPGYGRDHTLNRKRAAPGGAWRCSEAVSYRHGAPNGAWTERTARASDGSEEGRRRR